MLNRVTLKDCAYTGEGGGGNSLFLNAVIWAIFLDCGLPIFLRFSLSPGLIPVNMVFVCVEWGSVVCAESCDVEKLRVHSITWFKTAFLKAYQCYDCFRKIHDQVLCFVWRGRGE